MKIVYGKCYSFTLWCVVIWEIYLNFVVKISKKQVNGFEFKFFLRQLGYVVILSQIVVQKI